jgi:3-hydroxyacyl-[acyl-carrier-protein] dehydratase
MPDNAVLSLIPHRPPFLWVDEIEFLDPGVRCVALKSIETDLDVFRGHFPGDPVLPGVLLIEAAAQTAALMMAAPIASEARWAGRSPRMGAVNWFKFYAPVLPGALLRVETTIKLEVGTLVCVTAKLSVAAGTVAEGELTLTVAGR